MDVGKRAVAGAAAPGLPRVPGPKFRTEVLGAFLALGLGLGGCNWTIFDDFQADAPTRVTDEPDDYRANGFGGVMAYTTGPFFDQEVSQVLVSAGADTPLVTYAGWDGGAWSFESLTELCKTSGDCPASTGFDLVGIPLWRVDDPDGPFRVCFLATVPEIGGFEVSCAAPAVRERGEFFSADGALQGLELGASAAALGSGLAGVAPLGVAILGAPGADEEAGAVYWSEDDGEVFRFSLPEGVIEAGSRLGAEVAATSLGSGDEALVAAWAAGNASLPPQVLVFFLDEDGPELRACLEPPDGAEGAGFGQALAFGDLDGDGRRELVVGGDADANDRGETVWVYPGDGLPENGVDACQGWETPEQPLSCPELDEVACEDNGFGDALAVGDVDADGVSDLLVGAPLSDVDGAVNSGAVYVFLGGDGGPSGQEGQLLVDSSPNGGEEIGREVLAVPSAFGVEPRAEVVAGAPGGDRVYQFLCVPAELDDESLAPRCQP
jgi:hypothetical protein